MSDRITLKSYFETGDVPTEAQFADLIDSVGLLTEVNAKQDALTFGTSGQIPYTNATGDDYDYSSNLVWDNANIRLGIGTTTPSYSVHSTGSAQFEGGYIYGDTTARYMRLDASGSWLYYGSTTFRVSNNKTEITGNELTVRVGRAAFKSSLYVGGADGTPSGRLHVVGSDNTTGVNTLLTSLDGTELFKVTNDGMVNLYKTGVSLKIANYISISSVSNSILVGRDASAVYFAYGFGSQDIHIGSNGTGDVLFRNTGNVVLEKTTSRLGIGTTTPTSKLQVVGLSTYANNAAAIIAGLTAGALYIRTGHGLDIVT